MITFAKLCNHNKYFSILLFFLFFLRKKNFLSRQLFLFFLAKKTGEDGLLKLRLTFDALSTPREKNTQRRETTRIRSLKSDKRIPWTKMKSTREAEKKQNRR